MSEPAATRASSIHATAIVIGEIGVLLRGASGSGKSSLALALIGLARQSGRFARLVGDDRVRLELAGGRVIARPHPAIEGLVERRGQGIGSIPHEAAAVVSCVVDFVSGDPTRDIPPRAPRPDESRVRLLGVSLPRLLVATGTSPEEAARRVDAFLPGLSGPVDAFCLRISSQRTK